MSAENLMAKLKAESPDRRAMMLADAVRAALREILVIPEDQEVEDERSFSDLGLDSFTAVQLRNALLKVFGEDLKIEATEIFDHPSIKELLPFLASKMAIEMQFKD